MVEDSTNVDSLMKQVASKKPDLLEIRLDRLHRRELIEEVANRKLSPLIATDKSSRSARESLEQLSFAISEGFDIVDLDISSTDSTTVKRLKSEGAEVILSFHDYSQTPPREELTRILEAEKGLNGDICKIVTTACLPRDNLTILSFVESEARKARLVSFAMGKEGVPSRILSPLFGAEFTFASLTDYSRTAEGQLSIDALRSAWQILGF